MFLFITYLLVFKILQSYISEDTFFLLSTGREIINNGIIYENPFFVLPGYNLVVQQWLYDVILYMSYNILGNLGLLVIVLFSTCFCYISLYLLAKEFNVDSVISSIITLAFFLVNIESVSTRPTILTLGLLFSQLLFCERYKKYNKKKYLFYIVLIAILEVNLHACLWFMHLLFLLPYIVPNIKNPFIHFKGNNENNCFIYFNNEKDSITFFIVAVIVFCCGIVNPYGYKGWYSLFQTDIKALANLGISELQPILFLQMWPIMLIVTLCLVAANKHKLHNIESEYFYLSLGLIVFGSIVRRNIIYGTVGIIIISLYFFKDTDYGNIHKFINKQKIQVYLFVALAFCLSTLSLSKQGICKIKDSTRTPIEAVNYLDTYANKGDKVCTLFNEGSYLEWSGYKIYMEGRTEGYFEGINGKEDIIAEYYGLKKGFNQIEYQSFKDKYKFDYIITNNYDIAFAALVDVDPNTDLVLIGNGYKLYSVKK